MGLPTLDRSAEIFTVDFGEDDNTTTDEWCTSVHTLLDEVEAVDGPKVLVTTGSAKHYSNGLDVAFMASVGPDQTKAYVKRVETVVRRLLLFPAPTVAAINGHAFGIGAFLVIAHDHAVMRDDRGYICFPEVHISMTFPRSLLSLVDDVVRPDTRRKALATGHRYTAAQAQDAGLIDVTSSLDALYDTAASLGRPHAATAGPILAKIKHQLHRTPADLLGQ